MKSFFQKVYSVVRQIPKGRVATYGQVALLCGNPRAARTVGWALHQLDTAPDGSVPWQRVINRHGMISTTCLDHTADEQALSLKEEGVEVVQREGNWFVDLTRFQWRSNLQKRPHTP